MAGRIGNDELARCGVEVAVRHVNRDALFALGLQAIGQQRQVGLPATLHASELVLQHRFAVDQQATNQRAFAVVNTAAGDEAQSGAGVLLVRAARGGEGDG